MRWMPMVTGDWATDNATGRKHADALVARMNESNNPTMLAHTMKSMVGNGDWTGVEVGFFYRISEVLMASGCRRCAAMLDRGPDQADETSCQNDDCCE